MKTIEQILQKKHSIDQFIFKDNYQMVQILIIILNNFILKFLVLNLF